MKSQSNVETTPAAAAPQKESEQIALKIEEARSQIAAKKVELETIPEQKEKILGEVEIDNAALEDVELREYILGRELTNLNTRIVLLEKRRQEALKKEGAVRLEEIAQEAARLVDAEALALAGYDEAVTLLKERAAALASLHTAHRELVLESVFLLDRFHLNRANIARPEELPNAGETGTEVARIFSAGRDASLSSPWIRRRQQLQQERSQERRPESATPEPKQVEVGPVKATVTIPAKPIHDEGNRPNKLQELLHGTRH